MLCLPSLITLSFFLRHQLKKTYFSLIVKKKTNAGSCWELKRPQQRILSSASELLRRLQQRRRVKRPATSYQSGRHRKQPYQICPRRSSRRRSESCRTRWLALAGEINNHQSKLLPFFLTGFSCLVWNYYKFRALSSVMQANLCCWIKWINTKKKEKQKIIYQMGLIVHKNSNFILNWIITIFTFCIYLNSFFFLLEFLVNPYPLWVQAGFYFATNFNINQGFVLPAFFRCVIFTHYLISLGCLISF